MSIDILIQAGALGVLVLVLIGIGKIAKTLVDAWIAQVKELVAETKLQTQTLIKLVERLDSHELELKARRCIYRDRDGTPTEGVSGYPRRMAPSVPDMG